ncbi:hypothetical protein GCM10020256_50490 [Streptomyces thermocoprophilus]
MPPHRPPHPPPSRPRTSSALPPLRWFREESPGLLETIRQTHRAGLWHLCTALASAAAGYYEAAALWSDWQESHELALDAARETEDLLAEAVVLRSLADLEWQRHHPNAARDLYRLAWQLFTRAGHRVGAGRCLSGEADVLLGLGRVARAERNYARALSVARTEADPRGEADAERGLALVAQREGRLPEAHSRLTACATAAARAGDERWHAYATRRAATVTESAGGDSATGGAAGGLAVPGELTTRRRREEDVSGGARAHRAAHTQSKDLRNRPSHRGRTPPARPRPRHGQVALPQPPTETGRRGHPGARGTTQTPPRRSAGENDGPPDKGPRGTAHKGHHRHAGAKGRGEPRESPLTPPGESAATASTAQDCNPQARSWT